jgi:hypothetical protein
MISSSTGNVCLLTLPQDSVVHRQCLPTHSSTGFRRPPAMFVYLLFHSIPSATGNGCLLTLPYDSVVHRQFLLTHSSTWFRRPAAMFAYSLFHMISSTTGNVCLPTHDSVVYRQCLPLHTSNAHLYKYKFLWVNGRINCRRGSWYWTVYFKFFTVISHLLLINLTFILWLLKLFLL